MTPPLCTCGHRYDRHRDFGDYRGGGCMVCSCTAYRPASPTDCGPPSEHAERLEAYADSKRNAPGAEKTIAALRAGAEALREVARLQERCEQLESALREIDFNAAEWNLKAVRAAARAALSTTEGETND